MKLAKYTPGIYGLAGFSALDLLTLKRQRWKRIKKCVSRGPNVSGRRVEKGRCRSIFQDFLKIQVFVLTL